MADSSIFWLRAAAILYALAMLQSMYVILKGSNSLYGLAQSVFRVGVVIHGVAIVELVMSEGRLPVENFYGTISVCGFLVALVFLYVIASIFIWGGELNAAIVRWREYGKAQAEMAPAEE